MAGRYGRRCMKKDEDFDEEEVWGVTEERENASPRLRSSIKKIPRSSSSSMEAPTRNKQQFSAPLDIPDWSKIYGKSTNPKNKSHNYNFATHSSSAAAAASWVHHHHDHDGGCGNVHDDDDDEEDGMVPPHEYLARKLARSQISSFSVCEGFGRTLKGRDLSKVRNAILTKTGFLES